MFRNALVLAIPFLAACHPSTAPAPRTPAYLDWHLAPGVRAADLVHRMTLDEKVSQMTNSAAAIPRLDVPDYNWWSEALHGVARNGIATVFPQAIGLAATWDTTLMHQVAHVIGVEARAKFAVAERSGRHSTYQGLDFWSPNINIFRDPRWGRGMETYGEDPWLTGRMAVAFVRGLQGDDPHYFLAIATPKHFAVHSGPEPARHGFDAVVSNRDLLTTYLPAFQAAITEGHAESIMCAYNRVDSLPACGNPQLLTHILRSEWGFGGYVVTDCDAIDDMVHGHHIDSTIANADVRALRAGTDLNCGNSFLALGDAVRQRQATESDVDTAVTRLFTARMRLGLFDPPSHVRYDRIPADSNDTPGHAALALRAAEASMVLLKNNGVLPLDRRSVHSIAVIGPNADNVEILLGNYNGTASHPITPLQGIRDAAGTGIAVRYARGSTWAPGLRDADVDSVLHREALDSARQADVVILCLGLSPRLEGEESRLDIPGFLGGDRTTLDLPPNQKQLLEDVTALGKPVVLVLMSGSAVAVNWANDHVAAILSAWYPGEAAGTAVARTLFGDNNPGGRLPVTFYRSVADLPAFTDYDMQGHTYRYFEGTPLYPFGFGLSYTTFAYTNLDVPPRVRLGKPLSIKATVSNTGPRAGDDVVEVYLTDRSASVPVPIRSLVGFARVTLQPGASRTVRFTISPRQRSVVSDAGAWQEHTGQFELSVGGGQPDTPASGVRTSTFVVTP
jgi:beta-glucosidase